MLLVVVVVVGQSGGVVVVTSTGCPLGVVAVRVPESPVVRVRVDRASTVPRVVWPALTVRGT